MPKFLKFLNSNINGKRILPLWLSIRRKPFLQLSQFKNLHSFTSIDAVKLNLWNSNSYSKHHPELVTELLCKVKSYKTIKVSQLTLWSPCLTSSHFRRPQQPATTRQSLSTVFSHTNKPQIDISEIKIDVSMD